MSIFQVRILVCKKFHGVPKNFIKISVNFKTREPRGFAYVEMEDNEGAANAQAQADGLEFNGVKMTVQFAEGERKSIK